MPRRITSVIGVMLILALATGCKDRASHGISSTSEFYEHDFKSYAQYVRAHTGYILSPVKGFRDYGEYDVMWGANSSLDLSFTAGDMGAVCLVSRDRNCLIMYGAVLQELAISPDHLPVMSRRRIRDELVGNLCDSTGMAPYVRLGDYLEVRTAADYQLARTPEDSVLFYTFPNGRAVCLIGERDGLGQFKKQSLPYCMGIEIASRGASQMHFKVLFSEEGFKKKETYIGKLMDSLVAWQNK